MNLSQQWNGQTACSASGKGKCPHQHPCGLPFRTHSNFFPSPLRSGKGKKVARAACTSLSALPPVHLYNLAEAAASTSDTASSSGAAEVLNKSGGGWLAPLTSSLEELLRILQTGLDTLHVPYSYGYSIILLTLIVKTATYPLTKQQVESALAVQSLKPRIDLIKARYGEDQDKISKETSVLYEQAGVNPLAGCLPTLATIPIFIGLYSSLTNVASQGLLDTELDPPSAAKVSLRLLEKIAAALLGLPNNALRVAQSSSSSALLLFCSFVPQYVSTAVVSPPVDPNDKNAATAKALTSFLPLMVGWFALNVPSGLTLYYLSNTLVTMAQQVYLRKLGGASIKVNDLGPVTRPGSGRRAGVPATDFQPWKSQVAAAVAAREAAELAALDDDEQASATLQQEQQQQQQQQQQALAAPNNVASLEPANRFVKRKRMDRMARA
ncbi:60Kd inner membrane protein-domain-containing protein [Dunaliella salina]|uniref:60Kd inner membrane protein-domain-containing protein n=1 Tax=Dunaliella salina TaxID=3046 RepID=A0ABQ7H2W0_DUNSA|nr:60Kd inner membrane protein-domain-containing protein [Dunaliella salina]|eukprot:KAF5841180.1 60Kd inner membrane protein-domain-containing protein [Dunaliella salina]